MSMSRLNYKLPRLALGLIFPLLLIVGGIDVAAAHVPVALLNADGQAIDAPVPGIPAPAFSMKRTCGDCHDYDKIEGHSFHAQTGANEIFGWDAWNPDSPNPLKSGVLLEGKPWVQTPGHVGSWDPPSARQTARLFQGVSGLSGYDAATARFNDVNSTNWVPYDYGSGEAFREQVDLSIPGGMMDCGECHVGGGAMEYVPAATPYARVPLRDIAKDQRQAVVLDATGKPVLLTSGFKPRTQTATVPNNVNGFGGPIGPENYTAFNYFIDVYDVDGDGDRNEVQYIDYAKTGVLEMDCFLCHLQGYGYAARKGALRSGRFDASRAIGAGVASANGLTWDSSAGPADGYGTTVLYNSQVGVATDYLWRQTLVFSEDFFSQRLKRTPLSENCANCHQNKGAVDWKKRGDHWAPGGIKDYRYEVHYSIGCLGCHQRKDGVALSNWSMGDLSSYPAMGVGTLGHDPAKGDVSFSAVFDANDTAAFKRCVDCHVLGVGIGTAYGAPNPTLAHIRAGLSAKVVQNSANYDGIPDISHIELMDCTTCHVRKISSAVWNSGGALVDATGVDATGHLFDYSNPWVDRDNMQDRTTLAWQKGLLIRTNVLTTLFWRDGNDDDFDVNSDGRMGGLDPLLQTQVLAANAAQGWKAITANAAGQVTAALINQRVAALNSTLNDWGNSGGQADVRMSLMSVPFKINHGVSPKVDSLGAQGCSDCHAPGAKFYSGAVSPIGDGSSIYWDDDRVPFTLVNGKTQATDFDPRLRNKDGKRSIAVEFSNVPLSIDTNGDTLPEAYQGVRSFDRAELLWETDFMAPASFAAAYSSDSAIDFSGSEIGWLLKIEASADGGSSVVSRSRVVGSNVATVNELLADLGGFAGGDFEFTLSDNGQGGLTLTGTNGYLVRLHAQAGAADFRLARAHWQDVQILGTNGASYDGRSDWVAYLNTLGDPALVGIGIDPVAEMLPMPMTIEIGSTVTLAANTSVNTVGTFSYSWICNDTSGEILSGATVSKTFSKYGSWLITLKVVDEEGKGAQLSGVVNVVAKAPLSGITATDNGSGNVQLVTFNNLLPHTMLYVLWGDGTKEQIYDFAASKSVAHTFKPLSKYFMTSLGKYEYKISLSVYDGSTRVDLKLQTITISP